MNSIIQLENNMRNYKVAKCSLINLRKGDKVLSNYLQNNSSWYSFIFISIKSNIGRYVLDPRSGILKVIGGDCDEYRFKNITTFYKVEDDFPDLWGTIIDHLYLNI